MIKSCSALQYELSEIVSALQQSNGSSSDSPSSLNLYIAAPDCVYHTGNIIGRLRALLDRLWKWLTSSNDQSTLKNAVEGIIHQLFDHHVTEAYKAKQRHLAHHIRLIESRFQLEIEDDQRLAQKSRYYTQISDELQDSVVNLGDLQANFEAALERGPLKEKELGTLRCLVTKVSQAVRVFWYKMLYFSATFAAPLQTYLPNDSTFLSTEKPISWAVTSLELYQAIYQEQQWIDLEGMLNQPIPLVEFIKICQPHAKLNISEKRRLNKWIAALNQQIASTPVNKRSKIVHLVKNALEETVKVTNIQGQFKLSVGLLASKLDELGCHLLGLEDFEHKAWRDNLKEGEAIICEGVEYIVGEEIQSAVEKRNRSADRYRVFRVRNYPDLVIKIGKHSLALAIASHRFQHHFAIPSIEGVQTVLQVDSRHSISLLERQAISLKERSWTTNNWRLTPEDEKTAWPFTAFLFCMKDWREWPEGEVVNRLFLNKDNHLTISSSLAHGPDNYLAAENACIEAAKGNSKEVNPFLLHYFLEVSDYSRHPMAKFYRKNVQTMLEIGDFDFFTLSLPRDFNEDHYKARLLELDRLAKGLREKCIDEVFAYIRRVKQQNNTLLKSEKPCSRALKWVKSWKHVANENKGLIREMKETSSELHAMQKEWRASQRALKKSSDSISEEVESKRYKSLEAIVKELQEREAFLEAEILTLTVYDRLLSAYFAFAPPASLPEFLVEVVLKSFTDLAFEIPTSFPKDYYQEEQEMLIAKMRYAIEILNKRSIENPLV